MKLELHKVSIPIWFILTIFLIATICGLLCWYWFIDSNNAKLYGIVGGVATGLIVYLATFLTVLRPFLKLENFNRMGIKALLPNRHDQSYYRKLVIKSRQRVDVMGASCGRFVRDFLDVDSDDKVLVDALYKAAHLRVRLLVPDAAHMSEEANSSMTTTAALLRRVREQYGDRVEMRRFADSARHSFVIVDNDLVAGPIFDEGQSRHAPAVHVSLETLFGQKYAGFFETLWEDAEVVA